MNSYRIIFQWGNSMELEDFEEDDIIEEIEEEKNSKNRSTRVFIPPEATDVITHEVFEKNINGIFYYTDHEKRLFSISDIIQRKINPAIVGRWFTDETNGCQIELFCLK